METQTELQTYLEQGQTALAQGHAREAAIAYAHGAQIEPDNPAVHLGLAEANLGLGNYGVVQMACRRVFEVQPGTGFERSIAQALLDLLDRRYERALQSIDALIRDNPGTAYVHALRSYLLRANGQDYDANLARARATRLSYGGRFENIFPALDPPAEKKQNGATNGAATSAQIMKGETPPKAPRADREREKEIVPAWSRPGGMQRRLIRTRFMLSQNPGLFTNILIGIFLAVFVLLEIFDKHNTIRFALAPFIDLVFAGEIWRPITGIFLVSQFLSLILILLSLFFVGRAVELFYGPVRYVGLFLLAGIIGNLLPAVFHFQIGMGAGGATMGVFGALGAFYIANRRALGVYGSSAVINWAIWLGMILIFDLSAAGTTLLSLDLALLVITMIIAFLLLPRSKNRNSFF